MGILFFSRFLPAFFTVLLASSGLLAQPQYDLRFVHSGTSCGLEEIYIDIEIKASWPTSGFGIGIQNYRFNFNLTTVPAINPPIGPPNTNPPDRSVYISQELAISGTMLPTWDYDPHTLSGSSGSLVSYNVNLPGGFPGYPITSNTWVPIGRLRMNLADPMPPCLNLIWDVSNTLVLTGAFSIATIGTLSNRTVCGICQTLPVELARFEVKESNCVALIEWETLSEINSSHFLVEKSLDGTNFESIGRVEAAGNSTTATHYLFEDELINKENYYRLNQVDNNGESNLSEVRFAASSCFQETPGTGFISLYPNPVRTSQKIKIQVNALDSESGILEITNVSGQVVKSKEYDLIEGPNLLTANTLGLIRGIYFLRFISPSVSIESVKLVIVGG